MSREQDLQRRGTFSGTLCYRRSALHLCRSSNPGNFHPYLHNWRLTVWAEELAPGLLFSPPGSNKTEAKNTSNVLAWPGDGSAKSVESLHFDGVVFFELLKGDSVGIRSWAWVADKLGEWIFLRHHNIIIINSLLAKISINQTKQDENYYQRKALVLFFVVRPSPIVEAFLGCISSSTLLERALSFS